MHAILFRLFFLIGALALPGSIAAQSDTSGSSDPSPVAEPGPNNPVGGIWIDLTKEGYGIHGSPDPELIGKTASHGCVRLTNWDASELAGAVSQGIPVEFF